jgi:hypothetical protein
MGMDRVLDRGRDRGLAGLIRLLKPLILAVLGKYNHL